MTWQRARYHRGMTDTAESPRRGRPPGIKLKERGMLRLDDETFEWLVAQAKREGKPRGAVAREAIRHYCAPENAE